MDRERGPPPLITGLSPIEGKPGTQITIRGENLGRDANDLLMLYICDTDCLLSAKWISASKITARVGNANRGQGDIRIATKSGGRGSSNVKFRVFIHQVDPLEESAVWVDESKSVPGREAIRNVAAVVKDVDALGLRPTKKMDASSLVREFGQEHAVSDLRMESFNPQCYLLENYYDATLGQLKDGIANLELAKADQERKNEEMHRAHLYSLVSAVTTLANLHARMEEHRGDMAVTKLISERIGEARSNAESVFKDVLARKDTADATRNALSILTRFKSIFYLPKSIDENMAKGDYSTVLNDWSRAKALVKDYEVTLFKEFMAQVELKMLVFRDELRRKLIDCPTSFEEQSRLIKYLKILDPASDPAWDCITSYHCWLESCLWELQNKHCLQAEEEERQAVQFHLTDSSSRRLFVNALVEFLQAKLQVFWKLTTGYNVQDDKYRERQEDINQMLTLTINLSSWLLLNALVPKTLPSDVLSQYGEQFAKWPPIAPAETRALLAFSLKTLRKLISSLLDSQLSPAHVAPLTELSMTVRLNSLSHTINSTIAVVHGLHTKEAWRLEYLDRGATKTALPDLYENEVSECIGNLREELSASGYAGEIDLFSREIFRNTLIELALNLVCSVKKTMDELLNLKKDGGVTTRRLLITICNLEYVLGHSLKKVAHRLREAGFKYSDVVYEKSRSKLHTYRAQLVQMYLSMRHTAALPIIRSATYDMLPAEDVSDWAKELLISIVLAQAELAVNAPQLSAECLRALVQSSMDAVLEHLANNLPNDTEARPQCVIDLSAIEGALGPFLSLQTKTYLNSFRAAMVDNLDQEKLTRSIAAMRSSMRMAIVTLEVAGAEASAHGEADGESDV